MEDLGRFLFNEPVKKVEQSDRAPKKIFILGVYASAVHAKWISPKGKTLIKALAVASEPYIFWRGDGVEDIINKMDWAKSLLLNVMEHPITAVPKLTPGICLGRKDWKRMDSFSIVSGQLNGGKTQKKKLMS